MHVVSDIRGSTVHSVVYIVACVPLTADIRGPLQGMSVCWAVCEWLKCGGDASPVGVPSGTLSWDRHWR